MSIQNNGGLIQSGFGDVELSRSEIDYSKLAIDINPLTHLTAEIHNFLKINKIDDHIQIRRKHIKFIEPVMCNRLMFHLIDLYKNDPCITNVCIFDAVTEFIDVEPADFYECLTDKIKLLLKKSLQQNLGYKLNLDVDRDELGKHGYTQVNI